MEHIKTWQMRSGMNAIMLPPEAAVHIAAEIADLRAALAAKEQRVADNVNHDIADRLAGWLSASMDQHAAVDEMRTHIRAWLDSQPTHAAKEQREAVAWCVENPNGTGVMIYGNGAALKAGDQLYLATPPAAPVADGGDAVLAAANAVVREALDRVRVHVCDHHDDSVRAKGLYGSMADLYAAIAASAASGVKP